MDFKLHPWLAEDCYYLGDFPLCALLLSKDANYPWYILVPRQAGIVEAFQLNKQDQQTLQDESLQFSQALSAAFSADKMNIAALGNMVPQLHLHHIVRYKHDAAWPNPIWGHVSAKQYTPSALQDRIQKTHQLLGQMHFTPNLQTS
ncbi:MAG: HIT domain-containing protein [Cycloclasticus pugetii]|jgi:diadenosine tetraphosphate (Ap4A) HIT family hydrolase|uniref:HIT domain-containing protein n=1 Tax=Cycloclasticus TaxID=34067 RepID=UPI000286AAB8|nr:MULTISPECIES: HIT domain-containing protein [Cycloclasticus]AFT67924.1 Diadenosine tetraphosphate (Ap4A) hydrolase and other HIT family Hydrolase [Cycloclasticus sp. P1]